MNERHRIGLLIPASDVAMEHDLWRRLPANVSLHVARMYMESTTVAGEEKMLREELLPAARRVASVLPELVFFGCTSAAAIFGIDGDATIAQQISQVAGCPSITVLQASFREIRSVDPKRLLLITPYIPEVTGRMQNTFRQAGLPVIGYTCLGLDQDLAIGAVSPAEIKEFVIRSVRESPENPDSVFISCTTFQALEVAGELEQELGIPVLTSNTCVLQAIRRFAAQKTPVS